MKVKEEQIKYMVQRYVQGKQNTYQIGNDLGLSNVTVGAYLKREGVILSNQKYKFNENYFKIINSSDKAYFLGLIYADGSVLVSKNSLSIKLTKEDGYILEVFKDRVRSTKPLYLRKSEPIVGTSYIGKAQLKIELNSKTLINDLNRLGVTQNKSQTLNFPTKDQVPIEFMSDFIRGFFDGDGCIYNSQNRIMLNFVSNEFFLLELSTFLKKELAITLTYHKDKRSNSWFMFVGRTTDVLKFCKYIYQDEDCTKLFRKYEKYKNYLDSNNYLDTLKCTYEIIENENSISFNNLTTLTSHLGVSRRHFDAKFKNSNEIEFGNNLIKRIKI